MARRKGGRNRSVRLTPLGLHILHLIDLGAYEYEKRRARPRVVAARDHTFVIDARGADPAGLARLEAMISRLDGKLKR